MKLPRFLLAAAALAAFASACGPRVSVHFQEDENFNVTSYGLASQYTIADMEELAQSEADWLCSKPAHSLGEQDCELSDGQVCFSAVYCCE
jgi:hypothetical protein